MAKDRRGIEITNEPGNFAKRCRARDEEYARIDHGWFLVFTVGPAAIAVYSVVGALLIRFFELEAYFGIVRP